MYLKFGIFVFLHDVVPVCARAVDFPPIQKIGELEGTHGSIGGILVEGIFWLLSGSLPDARDSSLQQQEAKRCRTGDERWTQVNFRRSLRR